MSTLAYTRSRTPTEILDATFQFYRARFGDLLVLCTLLLVPPVLVRAITPDPYGVVFELVGNLMYLVCQGAIAVLVAAALQDDRALSAGEVLRALRGRTGSVIAVSIMSGILMGLGTLLLVIPGIIAFVWLAVATPVAAIEGLKNSDALARSRELARGRFWHVFLTAALSWLIVVALIVGLMLVLGMALAMFDLPEQVTTMVAGLMMVPLFPIVGVAVSLLYFDLRIRHEGADLYALADMLPPAPAVNEA